MQAGDALVSGVPWHRRETAAYRALVRAVEDEFPGLYFEERRDQLVLAGEFQVVEDGKVLDRYEIEIDVPRGGPMAGMPVVREVGGRVPHSDDRHNPGGVTCLMVPDEFWYRHPNGLDLIEFLRGPVLGYFIGQSIVERGGKWPYGERAHGVRGIIEFYGALVGTTNPVRVHAFLTMAAAKKVRAHWRCPCGSGRRIDACHRRVVQHLRDHLPRQRLHVAADWVTLLLPVYNARR